MALRGIIPCKISTYICYKCLNPCLWGRLKPAQQFGTRFISVFHLLSSRLKWKNAIIFAAHAEARRWKWSDFTPCLPRWNMSIFFSSLVSQIFVSCIFVYRIAVTYFHRKVVEISHSDQFFGRVIEVRDGDEDLSADYLPLAYTDWLYDVSETYCSLRFRWAEY